LKEKVGSRKNKGAVEQSAVSSQAQTQGFNVDVGIELASGHRHLLGKGALVADAAARRAVQVLSTFSFLLPSTSYLLRRLFHFHRALYFAGDRG